GHIFVISSALVFPMIAKAVPAIQQKNFSRSSNSGKFFFIGRDQAGIQVRQVRRSCRLSSLHRQALECAGRISRDEIAVSCSPSLAHSGIVIIHKLIWQDGFYAFAVEFGIVVQERDDTPNAGWFNAGEGAGRVSHSGPRCPYGSDVTGVAAFSAFLIPAAVVPTPWNHRC